MYDLEENKKKKKKDELDEVQLAEVQNLVIKRFRRVKKDIIMDDDETCMITLLKNLSGYREPLPSTGGNKLQRNQSGGYNRQNSLNPRGASNGPPSSGK